MNRRLSSRQVHLDFHTSEFMEGVGSKFDKKQFQEALKVGHVNSITVFGKCHHGYFYYPSEVGTIHPGMEPGKDLAGEMMDACHEIGVYAPLYFTIGFSALDAEEHPEWIVRKRDGAYVARNIDFNAPKEAPRAECSWFHLCSAGGYRDYLYRMTEEACKRYERLDGLFFDIVFIEDTCYCDHCIRGMREMGLDPASEKDAKEYYQIQKKVTLDGIREILFTYHPEASIFFNSGGAEIHMPQWHYASTHFEMEDLPTVWDGYDKMPIRARYFAGLEKDYLAMTGKFHRSWGEFGGYKTAEALKQECAAILAHGARVSVGDQLHPLGAMDMDTYRTIGEAYAYVEQIEEYCFDVKETAKLGVLVSLDAQANEDMAKLLSDSQVDFDVVHGADDLMRFDTVIIPDRYRLSLEMGEAFSAYVKQGGKVMILGGGGLKEDAEEFAFTLPFVYLGKSEYDKDFFELGENAPENIVGAPVLCYTSAHRVAGEGNVYAKVREPYFSRTYEKYCSHYNTPYKEEQASYPAAVHSGNVLYVAHELSKMYREYGVVYHRRYFEWLLRKLYQKDLVKVEMPSGARIHLVKREEQKQYILHLLYASPIQRGEVGVLEDIVPLHDVKVQLFIEEEIQEMMLVPQKTALSFKKEGQQYQLTVPRVEGHQMIVIQYA